jgi:hypothetical protein
VTSDGTYIYFGTTQNGKTYTRAARATFLIVILLIFIFFIILIYIFLNTDDGGYVGGWSPTQWPFPPVGTTYYMVRRAFLSGTTAYFGAGSAYMAISTDSAMAVTGLAVSSTYISHFFPSSVLFSSSQWHLVRG